MQLVRCKDQSRQTLDEFYAELAQSEDDVSRNGGAAVLALIARLRALPHNRQVFGLTSHHRLCLLAEDSSQSPWYVIIVAMNKHHYYVESLMPIPTAPWPGVFVKGEAHSEDEAVQMIEIAMDKSGGWT